MAIAVRVWGMPGVRKQRAALSNGIAVLCRRVSWHGSQLLCSALSCAHVLHLPCPLHAL